jgi:hypothetical protein
MRQDAGVQHVRVGDDHAAAVPHGPPRVRRGVAIVGVRGHAHARRLGQSVELGHLVVRQGLGREEIQRPGRGLGEQRREHGQVVHERLAAGRGRGHDDVLPPQHGGHRQRLVRVQRLHAAAAQGLDQGRGHALGERPEVGGPHGLVVARDERQPALGVAGPLLQDLVGGRHRATLGRH